jgi:hypothetical protein
MACMLNSFPWANCPGKAGNMVTEVKSDTRCMETPVDFEQWIRAGPTLALHARRLHGRRGRFRAKAPAGITAYLPRNHECPALGPVPASRTGTADHDPCGFSVYYWSLSMVKVHARPGIMLTTQ